MKYYTKRGREFQMDTEDYDRLTKEGYTFQSVKRYILASLNGERILLHRLLMSPERHEEVDHINSIGTDNRKSNLRVCTHKENCYNKSYTTSKASNFKGVRRNTNKTRWQAYIMRNREFYHLGIFDEEKDAARAYNNKAKELFGEFARLNNV